MMKSLFAVILSLGLVIGCAARSDNVYVVEKTRTYHRETCSRVNMANTEVMTRKEAQILHLTPCPFCQPDRR